MSTQQQNSVCFFAPSQHPARGGVQTHLAATAEALGDLGWQVEIISPPAKTRSKLFGLLWLWWWSLAQWPRLKHHAVLHVHDVFLWFLPIRVLIQLRQWFGQKRPKIIMTFHGWEGHFPPTFWQKANKWLAQYASDHTFAVGAYIAQFYPIHPTAVIYGGVSCLQQSTPKKNNQNDQTMVFLGRLASDTGLPLVLAAFEMAKKQHSQHRTVLPHRVEFWGDGTLKLEAEKWGQVSGWVEEPLQMLSSLPAHSLVVASGYLSVLEALAAGLRVAEVADNPLKMAYYQLAPFRSLITICDSEQSLISWWSNATPLSSDQREQQKQLVCAQWSWSKVAQLYRDSYVS